MAKSSGTPSIPAIYATAVLDDSFCYLTSESKKPGQIAVVYHYCDLSSCFFDSDVSCPLLLFANKLNKRWFLGIEDSVAKNWKKKSSASRIWDHRWIVSMATPAHDNFLFCNGFSYPFICMH